MAGRDDQASYVPSADELRMQLLEAQMAELKRQEALRAAKDTQASQFEDDFLKNPVTDNEKAKIRSAVTNAAKAGKYEAMVYSFPSKLCTDGGRAINNNDPKWPDTLRGKAKAHFERYQSIAKPKGYRLKAMIISFPGGIPGDVGFFLNWEPEYHK